VTEQLLNQMVGQGGSQEDDQSSDQQDVNLEELAELVFKKLHEELLLENERTGRKIAGR
jgi:hypothetical protein